MIRLIWPPLWWERIKRAFSAPGTSPQGLVRVENPVAHTCGESMKGVVGRRVERIEEKPNNMVIRDNRLQNPSEARNKRAQSLTNTGLNEFRV